MYKKLLRPLFFALDPEKAHNLTFAWIKTTFRLPVAPSILKHLFTYKSKRLERKVFGLNFPNPIGLAAGFDKNAELIDEIAAFGFGFIEIGTVTPRPQPGNPKPRIFRLYDDQSLINRLGFKNKGLESAVNNLKKRKSDILIGGNIGKNKTTPNEEAHSDYLACFNGLFDYVDYFVVNVSSPNTPGLRALQEKEPLTRLLDMFQSENRKRDVPKPLLLKIAPDLTEPELDDIVEIAGTVGLSGLIATNTTIERNDLRSPKEKINKIGQGGLSGRALSKRSTEIIRYLHRKSEGKIPIIGVGGIFNVNDVVEKLDAGASLVQVYTGFVYEGPAMVSKINRALDKKHIV
jgi:dihydroorotate dehydrogenase